MLNAVFERRQLFDLILNRTDEVGRETALQRPQAFVRWFVEMYYMRPQEIFVSDGTKDGKVDLFCTTHDDETVQHHVLNSKFTASYSDRAPHQFYDEITRFRHAFENKTSRKAFLADMVRPELRQRYRTLLERYDAGAADLVFVTNHRLNAPQYRAIKSERLTVLHLEDLLQFMTDHIEDAMPKTSPLLLTGIGQVLSPETKDTEIPTSIVFARMIDFIKYMRKDPYDLLFARNVRLWLGKTSPNEDIRGTFDDAPREFVFSNNGITLLCERHSHDPGPRELLIENPRVVNGSQTLHSIRDVESPSTTARVMVRIIEVPPLNPNDLENDALKRREVISKISTRLNQQNPIKKWNLVSSDEFQYDLARYFRRKNLFYERREREWSQRSTELKSVGVRRGPKITELAQLMSCYYWKRKQLGPVTAKRTVNGLFEDTEKEHRYEIARQTPPQTAYQLYLLSVAVDREIAALARTRRYIANLRRHANLVLFSLIVKYLQAAGAQFGTSTLEEMLTQEREWTPLVRGCIESIRAAYGRDAKAYKKREGRDLTPNNYFKSSYVESWLKGTPKRALVAEARRLLKEPA